MSREFRCAYDLTSKIVKGSGYGVPEDGFNNVSSNLGTTIEFSGNLVDCDEKIYDDTEGAEKLDPNPNYGASLKLTTTATDTDGDGLPDILANGTATATITIQKKNAAGENMVASSDDDKYFLEISGGSLNKASDSLVNGTDTFVLQPSTSLGSVAEMLARSEHIEVDSGSIKIKFI